MMSKSPRDKLLGDMKRTKGARFNAARRLEREEQMMSRIASYASGAVIIITLLPVFFKLSEFWVATIALLTIGLSILILVFSITHTGNKLALRADQFQRCALEVNALRHTLLADDTADVREFSKKYDDVLSRYNINHDEVDYDKYRLEHPDEFEEVEKEEIQTARKKVSSLERGFEIFTTMLGIVTGLVTFGALSSIQDAAGKDLWEVLKQFFDK